jgi:tetratricopeptide (TPR) repeat protein
MSKGIILAVAIFLAVSCSTSASNTDSAQPEQPGSVAAPPETLTDASAALAEGNRLLDLNQTEQAIEAFKQAIALDPDLAEAYFKLGIAYSLIEQAQRGALTTGSESPLPGESGNSNRRRGEEPKPESVQYFEKAVDAYKRLIKKDPEDHAAYFNMGLALNKLNEDEDAEEALEKAVELNPDDSQYLTELGAIRIKLAQYREAIEPLKKALELDPENPEAIELLEDAEAGRKRVEFKPPNKDNTNTRRPDAGSPRSANSAARANSSTVPPGNSRSPVAAPANRVKPPE